MRKSEVIGPGKTHKQKFTNSLQSTKCLEMQEISYREYICRLFGEIYRIALQYGPSYFFWGKNKIRISSYIYHWPILMLLLFNKNFSRSQVYESWYLKKTGFRKTARVNMRWQTQISVHLFAVTTKILHILNGLFSWQTV